MTPVERLQAAIDKLERLKADSTPGPWHWEPPSGDNWPEEDESLIGGDGTSVLYGWGYDASGIRGSDIDRELIVTLHRTIDAQLAILRAAVKNEDVRRSDRLWSGALSYTALALADAILGGEA